MTNASPYKTFNTRVLDRVSVSDAAGPVLRGNGVVWVVDSISQEMIITLKDFDQNSPADFTNDGWGDYHKPCLILKLAADFSGNSVTIIDSAGTTLASFNEDYSSTPRYVVFRVKSGAEKVWELA